MDYYFICIYISNEKCPKRKGGEGGGGGGGGETEMDPSTTQNID